MGSFLMKCGATKNLLREGSKAQVIIFKQKLTSSFNEVEKLDILIPAQEKHIVCTYKARVDDCGFFTPDTEDNQMVLNKMLSLLPSLVKNEKTYHLNSLIAAINSEIKIERHDGTDREIDNQGRFLDRYPLVEVLEYITEHPQWNEIEKFISGIHYNINKKCTLIKENGEFYILRASVYKNNVVDKCLKVEMEDNGTIYTSASDYVKQRKNDKILANIPQSEIKEYLQYEYLFKLGLPTDIPTYGGQDYENYQGKAYAKYVALTK